MPLTLEVLPAAAGDCLILHWGAGGIAVVDGGPARTYETTLKPRLLEIKEARRAACLSLDLVMVSHVDNDHVVGIKKLFSELQDEEDRQDADLDRPLRVERLWHNTFADILGAPAPTPQSMGVEVAQNLSLVLAGHGEGRSLRDAHARLYNAQRTQRLNAPFQTGAERLITDESPPGPACVEGLHITILGPQRADIVKLKTDFDRYLKHQGFTATAALAAVSKDVSPTNLSSLVCLAEFAGRSILLTGDARGDKIVEGLRKAKRLTRGVLEVDVLKVPHHGSERNATLDLFQAVKARQYVISADGHYGNPARLAIEWLFASRAPGECFDLCFTYPVAQLDQTRQELQKTPWREERDSIQHLIAAKKAAGYRVTVSEGYHVIALGDAPTP